jgi:hypothetical protein
MSPVSVLRDFYSQLGKDTEWNYEDNWKLTPDLFPTHFLLDLEQVLSH